MKHSWKVWSILDRKVLDNQKRVAEWAAKWREADVLDRAVTEMTRNATMRARGGQQDELFDIVGDAA